MGLFSKKPRFVGVVYHDLAERTPESIDRSGYSYTFRWELKSKPIIGSWVWINGADGITTGMVVTTNPDIKHIEYKPVIRLLTQDELNRFATAKQHAEQMKAYNERVWLDMARMKAGLPVGWEVPTRVPKSHEPIPPARGRVVGEKAKDRGRVWWKLHRLSLEHGRPEEEFMRFKEIADFWYAQSRQET